MHAQPRRQRADATARSNRRAEQPAITTRWNVASSKKSPSQDVRDDHERIDEQQHEHRQVLQAEQRVQLPRVADADDEVDDVRALPAQLLVEVAASAWSRAFVKHIAFIVMRVL